MKRTPRAGVSAQRRYDEMASAWRRRKFGRAKWIVWPLLVASVLFSGLPSPYAYLAGMAAGVVVMAWVALNDNVPRHIQNWWDGAEGERQTEKVLRPLERAGWIVAHDLQGRFGNIDHLIVGPPGVFLLDTKHWRGLVRVDGDVPTVSQIEDPDATWSWPKLPGTMRRMCAANHEALRNLTGLSVWVNAVVVLWSPFEQGVVTANNVTFVHGQRLTGWLLEQPQRLTVEQVARLANVIGPAS